MTRAPKDLGRAYPSNVQAERALLGQILLDPEVLAAIPSLRPEHFYQPGHGALFRLLGEMVAEGKALDLPLVSQAILETGDPDAYGGIGYVVSLPEHAPSTSNPEHYAGIILWEAKRRRLIDGASRILDGAYGRNGDPDLLSDQLLAELMGDGRDETIAGGWINGQTLIDDTMAGVEAAQMDPASHGGISSGFRDLDEQLGNLHPEDLIVLAARPAMGKSALALNIAEYVCSDRRHEGHVGFFSLEMGARSLGRRSLAGQAAVSSMPMRTGRLTLPQVQAVRAAHQLLRKKLVRFWLDPTPGLTLTQLRARARRLQFVTGGLALIVVDYMQLIGGELGRQVSRQQEIGHVSRGLKKLAKDLKCPILALSQLNRGCEGRVNKRPLVSDLRESGDIEQDADVILFIYRDEVYNPEDARVRGLAELIVGKARSARSGTVHLNYSASQTRFSDLTIRQLQHGGRP